MKGGDGEGERFMRYLALVAGVGLLGLVGAYALPQTGEGRLGALVGVAVSVAAGGVVLGLKRWALSRSLNWALMMVGASFGIRLLAVTVGFAVVITRGAEKVAFIAGFFAVYFVLQWLEISYILASPGRGQGGV